MSRTINKVTMIGYLGGDPEIKNVNNKEMAIFSIATDESWKDKSTGEKKQITDWHRVVVFNDNVVQFLKKYIKKGALVYIEGKLKTRKWKGSDGMERYTTEVVIENYGGNLIALDKKIESDMVIPSKEEARDDFEDGIPF